MFFFCFFFHYLCYNEWSESRGSRHVRWTRKLSRFHLRFINLTERSGEGLKIAPSPRTEAARATATPNGLYIAMVTVINREVSPRTDSRQNRERQSAAFLRSDSSSPCTGSALPAPRDSVRAAPLGRRSAAMFSLVTRLKRGPTPDAIKAKLSQSVGIN